MADDFQAAIGAALNPSVYDEARKQYPILDTLGMQFKNNPGGGEGFLEFWPGDEEGDATHPRPKEFAPGKPGIEVYDPKTRPIDIIGDVASHYLAQSDPVVSKAYGDFEGSLSDAQRAKLQEQYAYAQQNEHEQRPYEDWYKASGLPAAFRGYTFQQWPQDFSDKFYSPEQKKALDGVLEYLRKPPVTDPHQQAVGSALRR